MSFGSSITYFVSGFIIDAFSWEGVFYATGITGILWCGAWWYLMFDRPELHPRLTDEEKQAIRGKTKINFSVENLVSHSLERRIIYSSSNLQNKEKN